MSNNYLESREAVRGAREALRRGDHARARRLAEKAARLAPRSEDPWLILAAIASPRTSLDYVKKALDANPESARAHRAMQWAMLRLQQAPQPHEKGREQAEPAAVTRQVRTAGRAKTEGKKRSLLFPVLFLLLGCIVVVAAAWSALSNPALASILSLASSTQPLPTEHSQAWAEAEVAKPTYTPTVLEPTLIPTATETPPPTDAPTLEPTSTPEFTVTPEPTVTPETASTPGMLEAVIVADTPTSEYAPPTSDAGAIAAAVYGERWIDVDLSQQRVYAYEGSALMNSFLVSTGTWQTPTVTGTYKIWIKLLSTTMTGPGYYLPNVPYTMYFFKGYGLHGTYWHHNFGTPMSHGCVNLSISDAKWLYNFASVGTTVNVHY